MAEKALYACDQCYRCKTRCGKELPQCQRCQHQDSICTYSVTSAEDEVGSRVSSAYASWAATSKAESWQQQQPRLQTPSTSANGCEPSIPMFKTWNHDNSAPFHLQYHTHTAPRVPGFRYHSDAQLSTGLLPSTESSNQPNAASPPLAVTSRIPPQANFETGLHEPPHQTSGPPLRTCHCIADILDLLNKYHVSKLYGETDPALEDIRDDIARLRQTLHCCVPRDPTALTKALFFLQRALAWMKQSQRNSSSALELYMQGTMVLATMESRLALEQEHSGDVRREALRSLLSVLQDGYRSAWAACGRRV